MFSEIKIGIRVIGYLLGSISQTGMQETKAEVNIRWIMRFCIGALITMILLIATLYVLLSGKYDSGTEKWASGIIGAILTYWVKDSPKLQDKS